MSHILEGFAYRRIRPATVTVTHEDGVDAYEWADKGSLIQRVSDKLLAQDESLLIKGRWRTLERSYYDRTTWMVRNGWWSLPILLLWRVSLALWYLALGCVGAVNALRGKEVH